jgi:hypothetical protein
MIVVQKVLGLINLDNSKLSSGDSNNPLSGLKMKKLKIVRNPLAQSLNLKELEHINLINLYGNARTPASNVFQHIDNNNFYNVNKVTNRQKQPYTTVLTQQAKGGKLTFDNVFNNKPTNGLVANLGSIPPIIIGGNLGNFQNHPQISININNFNINNYSSSVNKPKLELFGSPVKAEPIKVLYPKLSCENVTQQSTRITNESGYNRQLSNSKLVKKDINEEDSFVCPPHSNSNIIRKSKKVRF